MINFLPNIYTRCVAAFSKSKKTRLSSHVNCCNASAILNIETIENGQSGTR